MKPGAGLEGRLRRISTGREYYAAIGNRALVPADQEERFEQLADELRTESGVRTLALVVDGRAVAAAAVAEQPIDRVDEMLESFQDCGVEPVLMTGDHTERAERLGFETIHARQNPEQKEQLVRRLQDQSESVLYVGDGINDAAAMANADVGVAKASGSEVTVDTADVTWYGDDPTVIVDAVLRARESISLIKSNLGYAVVYNLAGVGAASAGWLHPVAAAVLMVVSSLVVTWRTALQLEA